MLQRPCTKTCKAQGKANLRRVFQEGRHPAIDMHLTEPRQWRVCAPMQSQDCPDLDDNGDDIGGEGDDNRSIDMKNLVRRLSTDAACGKAYPT